MAIVHYSFVATDGNYWLRGKLTFKHSRVGLYSCINNDWRILNDHSLGRVKRFPKWLCFMFWSTCRWISLWLFWAILACWNHISPSLTYLKVNISPMIWLRWFNQIFCNLLLCDYIERRADSLKWTGLEDSLTRTRMLYLVSFFDLVKIFWVCCWGFLDDNSLSMLKGFSCVLRYDDVDRISPLRQHHISLHRYRCIIYH